MFHAFSISTMQKQNPKHPHKITTRPPKYVSENLSRDGETVFLLDEHDLNSHFFSNWAKNPFSLYWSILSDIAWFHGEPFFTANAQEDLPTSNFSMRSWQFASFVLAMDAVSYSSIKAWMSLLKDNIHYQRSRNKLRLSAFHWYDLHQ